MMSTRAQSLFRPLALLTVSAIVILFMLSLADRYAKEESTSKLVLANDMALFSDTLLAAPGNLYLLYTRPLQAKKVDFHENRISVDEFHADYIASTEPQTLDFDSPKQLYFLKRSMQIIITDDLSKLPKSMEHLRCPTVDTKASLTEHTVLLDPQHGGTEKGMMVGSLIASEATTEIIRSIIDSNLAVKDHFLLTRPLDAGSSVSAEQRKEKSDESITMLISVGVGASPSHQDEQSAKAFILANDVRSRKLACTMLNTLASEYTLTSPPVIIEVDMQSMDSESPTSLLKPGLPSVVLEIGNLYYSGTQPLLAKSNYHSIGSVLSKGVVSYLQ